MYTEKILEQFPSRCDAAYGVLTCYTNHFCFLSEDRAAQSFWFGLGWYLFNIVTYRSYFVISIIVMVIIIIITDIPFLENKDSPYNT